MLWVIGERRELLVRELLFRLLCRHEQGQRPNIMLHCSRRGGSTWLLNILASQPGVRYVGRTLFALRQSRWRHKVPDLRAAARHDGDHHFQFIVNFSGEDELRFRQLINRVIAGELIVNPTLAIRSPFFQRRTDRIVFQMTSGTPLIGWIAQHFDVATTALFRHPIPTALSIQRSGWNHECLDFLHHQPFCEQHLNGNQMDLAWRIVRNSTGAELPAHILDWTLKMLLPFREVTSRAHPEWASLSYEQLVLQPSETLDYLSETLQLPDAAALRRQARQPSRSVSSETVAKVEDPKYLLSRWRGKITRDTESELMRIPRAFGIDLYTSGKDTPNDSLLGAPALESN